MKKPGYLKNTIATPKGYVSPKGELLKAAKLSPEAIAEWNGVTVEVEPINEVVVQDDVLTLEDLNKSELLEYANTKEIEVSKKDSKKKLLDKIFSAFAI